MNQDVSQRGKGIFGRRRSIFDGMTAMQVSFEDNPIDLLAAHDSHMNVGEIFKSRFSYPELFDTFDASHIERCSPIKD